MALSICPPGPKLPSAWAWCPPPCWLFLFMVEHFKVWEQRPADPERRPTEAARVRSGGRHLAGSSGHCGPHDLFAGIYCWQRLWDSGSCRSRRRRAAASSRRRFIRPAAAGHPLDRRQSGRLRRRVQARGAREARRRETVLREVPPHESSPRRGYGVCPLPSRHVPAGRRFPARLARVARRRTT